MSGKDKINVFPSRGAQTTMKARLKGAQKGHSLLKKKADALQMRFRIILQKIVATKTEMGDVMKDCAFSLAEAKFQAGEFNQVCQCDDCLLSTYTIFTSILYYVSQFSSIRRGITKVLKKGLE